MSGKKHWITYRRTYSVWSNMRNRCRNPNFNKYHRYGGRGIKVCERWDSFENFLADMGEQPPGLKLDRIDNDGDYEPGNCRWVDQKTQCRNTSVNRTVLFNGKTMSLIEACEITGLPYYTVHTRITRLGWPVDKALTTNPNVVLEPTIGDAT